jgi:hypothetical protein
LDVMVFLMVIWRKTFSWWNQKVLKSKVKNRRASFIKPCTSYNKTPKDLYEKINQYVQNQGLTKNDANHNLYHLLENKTNYSSWCSMWMIF